MTFGSSEFHPWVRVFQMFSFWGIRHGNLFYPRNAFGGEGFAQYDLTSKIYIFMKRLGQDYRTVMLMDADERDKLFEMEMTLIEEEKKQKEELSNKK